MEIKEVKEKIREILDDNESIVLKYDAIKDLIAPLNKIPVRQALIKDKIFYTLDEVNQTIEIKQLYPKTKTSSKKKKEKETVEEKTPEPEPENVDYEEYIRHEYIVPPFHEDMARSIQDASGMLVYGVGGTGTGKTEHLRILAEELDMKLYLINCKADMSTASFLGDKTIEVDKETGQNHIVWKDGPVVKAMQEGLDKDGNEVGQPGLLVIDEAPVMPSHIAIGFNNLLENWSTKRRLVLDEDGGRVINSHSGFRIVMLGNTIGKGITDLSDAAYTAQGDALDISTLDRIHVIFKYGYNRKAEEKILKAKVRNDVDIAKVLKMRDTIRKRYKANEIQTPFSTRIIVQLSDSYRVFRGDLGKAFYYTVLNKVLPDERGFYSEVARAVLDEDLDEKYGLGGMFD